MTAEPPARDAGKIAWHPDPALPSRDAQRLLFETVLEFTWKRLGRHRLSDADRQDVAQNVALIVLRRRANYRPERGSPEQWLSGVIRLEVKRFRRIEGKHPSRVVDEGPHEPAVDALTPEEGVSLHDIAERRLGMLPEEERRAVILVEIERLTFRQVAAREGISASTAFERHKRGLAALRSATEREGDSAGSGLLVVSLAAAGSELPREIVDQAWRRAVELGLFDLPEVAPQRRLTLPALGAMAAAGVACAFGGALLGRCTAERPREDLPAAIVVEAPPSAHASAVPGATTVSTIAAAPLADAKPVAIVAAGDDGQGERDILRQARFAIEQRDGARALALLARVRSARFASSRDRLRKEALAVQARAANR